MRAGYICLYDHNWVALGNWTQHLAKSWRLTRKAHEVDEFNCVCQGFENSKNACFIALHEPTGKMKYAAFCSIPEKKKNGLTSITGTDCRSIFNQELYVDYSQRSSGQYVVNSVKTLFQYLMSTVFIENSFTLGITYGLDLDELDYLSNVWNEDYITRTAEYRNVYEQLMAACACYDLYISAETSVDSETNKYKLTFVVHRIYNSRNIKLSDYDVVTKMNQNITNRVVYTTKDAPTTRYTLYLYNDNTIGSEYNVNKVLFPPVTEVVQEDDIDSARAKAYDILKENRFQDRVLIDLNGKLGLTLKDLDFSFYGNLVGYNPADESSIKTLPVCAIREDSNGNKSLQFGRLSQYWFMDN